MKCKVYLRNSIFMCEKTCKIFVRELTYFPFTSTFGSVMGQNGVPQIKTCSLADVLELGNRGLYSLKPNRSALERNHRDQVTV